MKQTTDKKLHTLVNETVKRVIKEALVSNQQYDQWKLIIDAIGADTIVDEIPDFFSSDDFDAFMESLISDYELEDLINPSNLDDNDEDEIDFNDLEDY